MDGPDAAVELVLSRRRVADEDEALGAARNRVLVALRLVREPDGVHEELRDADRLDPLGSGLSRLEVEPPVGPPEERQDRLPPAEVASLGVRDAAPYDPAPRLGAVAPAESQEPRLSEVRQDREELERRQEPQVSGERKLGPVRGQPPGRRERCRHRPPFAALAGKGSSSARRRRPRAARRRRGTPRASRGAARRLRRDGPVRCSSRSLRAASPRRSPSGRGP